MITFEIHHCDHIIAAKCTPYWAALWSICAFSKCFHTHMNALSNGKSSRILWESSSFWAYLFCQVTIMFVSVWGALKLGLSSWEKSFYCYHQLRLKRVQDLFKAVFMPHNQFINWENGFNEIASLYLTTIENHRKVSFFLRFYIILWPPFASLSSKPQSQHNKLPRGNVDVCESCENDLK